MGFGTKTGFGTFYSLVSSSPQDDGIIMGSLPEGITSPWAAPLKIWRRWAKSFRGYSRGVCPKTGFGTFYSLVDLSPYVDAIRIGSLQEGAPSLGQLPWKFGGDRPTPSMATPGVFTQSMGFGTKRGFGTYCSLVTTLIFNSEAINIFPTRSRCCHLQKGWRTKLIYFYSIDENLIQINTWWRSCLEENRSKIRHEIRQFWIDPSTICHHQGRIHRVSGTPPPNLIRILSFGRIFRQTFWKIILGFFLNGA